MMIRAGSGAAVPIFIQKNRNGRAAQLHASYAKRPEMTQSARSADGHRGKWAESPPRWIKSNQNASPPDVWPQPRSSNKNKKTRKKRNGWNEDKNKKKVTEGRLNWGNQTFYTFVWSLTGLNSVKKTFCFSENYGNSHTVHMYLCMSLTYANVTI